MRHTPIYLVAMMAGAVLLGGCSANLAPLQAIFWPQQKQTDHTKKPAPAKPTAPLFKPSKSSKQSVTPKNTVNAKPYSRSKGKRVLASADDMIRRKVCVRGSCWDYIDAIYNRAGITRKKRKTVFKSKKRGPYAPAKMLRPGDWLYFINTSFHNSEHSAIFVRWVDRKRKIARLISYQGQGKRKPARYKNYYVGKVYHIMRP